MKSSKKREVRRIRGSVGLAMNSATIEHPIDEATVTNGKAVYEYEAGEYHCDHELRCDWCCLQISACDGGSCFRCEHMFHVDCFWFHLEVSRRCSIQVEDHSGHDSSMDMDNNVTLKCCVDKSNANAVSDLLDSSVMYDTVRNIFAPHG